MLSFNFLIAGLVFGFISSAVTSQTTTYRPAGKFHGEYNGSNITPSFENVELNEVEDGDALTPRMSEDGSYGNEQRNLCPTLGTKQKPETLVVCQCPGRQIFQNGQCQHYSGDLVIDSEDIHPRQNRVPVSNFVVEIKDLDCDQEKSRRLQFTKGQFFVRTRGDVVLSESAGDLYGQRISNYCVTYHLDDLSDLTWTLEACVPIPSVPKCCPSDQTMKEGSCQPTKTPASLSPPISAKPFHHSVDWPNITNYLSPLTCRADSVKTIPLSFKDSHLLSLSAGLAYGWRPEGASSDPKYFRCPEFCVDGTENRDGSVSYSTSFCNEELEENWEQKCDGRPCLRKCCAIGEAVEATSFYCIPQNSSDFQPSTVLQFTDYNIVSGQLSCNSDLIDKTSFEIDIHGNLVFGNRRVHPREYCIDTFVREGKSVLRGLACTSNITETSTWMKARLILFPICHIISICFLSVTTVFHLLVPKLRENVGIYNLNHAFALMIGYIFLFRINVGRESISPLICIISAVGIQFGFLVAFFWLNVMCIENWRKFRELKKFLECRPYSTRLHVLYAWGIPFTICLITLVMQYLAPDDVKGLIKPRFAEPQCWFKDDIGLFVYFYGPAAILSTCNLVLLVLAYLDYKKMRQKKKESCKVMEEIINQEQPGIPLPYSRNPSTQLNDHVADFKLKLQLFFLMVLCWTTEVLSWKIPPPEIWATTDILNSLQGFFIFLFFILNKNKRSNMEARFPQLFQIPREIRKRFCGETKRHSSSTTSRGYVGKIESSLKQISTLPLKTISSLSSSVCDKAEMAMRQKHLDGSENGIVVKSYSNVPSCKSDISIENTSC